MPPQHEPNQPITLANTSIVEVDGQSVAVPVEVVLRLLPSPTILIEANALPNAVLRKERFQIRLGNGAEMETILGSFNFGTSQGYLIPARQPVDVIDRGLPIRKVKFGILNFPAVLGNQSIWIEGDQGSNAVPHVKLDLSDWFVEIKGVSNLSDVEKSLKQDRGYGLTYTGVVTYRDGAEFSVNSVEKLLEALRIFLSFARGTFCSLALVEGLDQNGQQSWVRWGAHHVEPWRSINSWFLLELNGADILSELFPEFWDLFESNGGWRDTILRAVDWYSQSNISPPYIGIILTVATLERLSFQILERRRMGGEPTGDFIKEALDKLQIPFDTPINCEDLQKVKQWRHGPQAVVETRNDLVHPEQKLDTSPTYAVHQAWDLGQWYIEMMLLRKLKYQGSYLNRLAGWRESDQAILPVPWAEKP